MIKGKERNHLIQEEIHSGVEERRMTKMVNLSQQEAWTRWEEMAKQRIK